MLVYPFGIDIPSSNSQQVAPLAQEELPRRTHAPTRTRPRCKQWTEMAMLAVTDLTDFQGPNVGRESGALPQPREI